MRCNLQVVAGELCSPFVRLTLRRLESLKMGIAPLFERFGRPKGNHLPGFVSKIEKHPDIVERC